MILQQQAFGPSYQEKMPPKQVAFIFNYKRMEKKLSF
jgi:hypothetical protein